MAIKSGMYSVQELLQKGVNCSSELLSPLWNGSTRHVYLSRLTAMLIDALKTLRHGADYIETFEQDFIKHVIPYAEANELTILRSYFPQLFE